MCMCARREATDIPYSLMTKVSACQAELLPFVLFSISISFILFIHPTHYLSVQVKTHLQYLRKASYVAYYCDQTEY